MAERRSGTKAPENTAKVKPLKFFPPAGRCPSWFKRDDDGELIKKRFEMLLRPARSCHAERVGRRLRCRMYGSFEESVDKDDCEE